MGEAQTGQERAYRLLQEPQASQPFGDCLRVSLSHPGVVEGNRGGNSHLKWREDAHAEGRQARMAGSPLGPHTLEQHYSKRRAEVLSAHWVSSYRTARLRTRWHPLGPAKGSVPSHSQHQAERSQG